MNTTPPSPAPASPAPPSAASDGTTINVARASSAGFLPRLVDTLLNWPRGRWPVPTVTSLFVIALLIVGVVEFLPRGLSDVTLTVRARTEVLELELQPQRTYIWWLPAGSYSLLTAKDAAGCERRNRFDLACSYNEPTAITIKNGATVRFELAAADGANAPRFSVALTPRAPARRRANGDASADEKAVASAFEVRNAADELLVETPELVTFESQPVSNWRIPLIVKRVQIGEFLSESIATADTLGTASQPIMTEGGVRMFARTFGLDERYQIKEEQFDPADVVQIPADAGMDGLLLGLLSLDATAQREFDLTLHTNLAEVFVRRLGAEHRIGISMWAIVSKLPMWLALWVVWVSLIVVANYYSDRLGELRGHKSETQPT